MPSITCCGSRPLNAKFNLNRLLFVCLPPPLLNTTIPGTSLSTTQGSPSQFTAPTLLINAFSARFRSAFRDKGMRGNTTRVDEDEADLSDDDEVDLSDDDDDDDDDDDLGVDDDVRDLGEDEDEGEPEDDGEGEVDDE